MNIDRFRVKAKNILGEWVYAEPYEDEDGAGLGLAWKRPEGRFQFHPVIKKTLCQCTGMKDSCGNRIYENDILEVETLDGNQTGNVYYQELIPSFRVWLPMYTTTIPALMSLAEMTGKKVRVVGNKWDKEGITDE